MLIFNNFQLVTYKFPPDESALNFDCNIWLFLQPDSPEYKAACKLWELYLRTKNEFVQKGDAEDDDDDEEGHDNQANSELVSVGMTAA